MGDFFSGAAAALIGGLIAGLFVVWQTQRILRHEAHQARKAAEEERQSARDGLTRAAASELLDALADYSISGYRGANRLRWFGGRMPERERDDLIGRVMRLRKANSSAAALLPAVARERWSRLCVLAGWLNSERGSESPNINHQIQGVLGYAEYVRQTIMAVLDGAPLPPEYAAPVLEGNSDDRIWGWKPTDPASEPDLTEWHRQRIAQN